MNEYAAGPVIRGFPAGFRTVPEMICVKAGPRRPE